MDFFRKYSSKNSKDNQKSYKRTSSDDVYQRLLKYNEESLKRAINDGYSKFMIPKIIEDDNINNNDNDDNDKKKKSLKNRAYLKQDLEHCTGNFNTNKIDFNHIKHNKYITRTSKAGTLIIKEESFINPNWRRRKSDNTTLVTFKQINDDGNLNLRKLSHSNSASTVTNFNKVISTNINNSNASNVTENLLDVYNGNGNSIDKDFKNIYATINDLSKIVDKVNNCFGNIKRNSVDVNSNYIVQEPPSDYSRKNSEAFVDKNNSVKKKSRKKLNKSYSDISVTRASFSSDSSSSSNTKDKECRLKRRSIIKGKTFLKSYLIRS